MNVLLILLAVYTQVVRSQWNTNEFMKREHSLIKPYQSAALNMPYWDFMGSTMVTKDYVRLTPDLQSQSGHLWNTVPLNVRNWDLQVHFKVHGKSKDLFGDGFVIWYAKDRMVDGKVFGSKDYFSGLAIFMDTYNNHNGAHNHQHPYISAMVNNGSMSYDHDRDGTHTQLAGCEAKFRGVDHDTHVSIKYEKNTLIVSTDIENKMAWKECFKVEGVQLPTGYFIGVSAVTGALSDNHDIHSIRLFELDLPDTPKEDRSHISPSASFYEAPRERVEDVKPSWSNFKWFMVTLLSVLAIVACVVMGTAFYQQHQKNKRRLY